MKFVKISIRGGALQIYNLYLEGRISKKFDTHFYRVETIVLKIILTNASKRVGVHVNQCPKRSAEGEDFDLRDSCCKTKLVQS